MDLVTSIDGFRKQVWCEIANNQAFLKNERNLIKGDPVLACAKLFGHCDALIDAI